MISKSYQQLRNKLSLPAQQEALDRAKALAQPGEPGGEEGKGQGVRNGELHEVQTAGRV